MISAAFTAAQIAEALGLPRATVHRALQGVRPHGTRLVANNRAAVWRASDLPADLRARLENLQQTQGNIGAEQVLAHGRGDWWKPQLPLAQVHAEEIRAAQLLQSALKRALALPESATMKERETLAAGDYLAAFGRAVSDRYLRKLIGRTLQRDGGRRDFDRLEIYLPESPRPAAPTVAPLARRIEFEALETHFKGCADRGNPTASEIAYCWRGVVSFWQAQVEDGRDARELRAPLLEWLEHTLPRLGKSRAAMARNLDRKLAMAETAGAAAVLDRRAEKSGNRRRAPQWEENIEALARLARQWSGRIAQAWRALYLGTAPDGARFTDRFLAYFEAYDVRRDKSRVPSSVAAAVRPMLAATEALAHGPKAARLSGPRVARDWSDVRPGDAWTCDDVTQNHYFYHYAEDGEFEFAGRRFNVTRGQFLPVIDEATDYPLGFALIPHRTYNSRDILTLMARVCMAPEIGLPRRRFVLERGVWKALSLRNALVGWQERVSTGLARHGARELRIHHATTPGAKIIENWIGRLQNTMEHVPGYAGRDEKRDRFERTTSFLASLKRVGQPLKAERDPADFLLSRDQLAQEIEAAMQRLAAEPMNGKRHGGLSPEELWQRDWSGFHQVLPDSLRHLLSTDVSETTVRADGIWLTIGGERLNFYGAEKLGALIDEKVRVRFNPELPETVTVCHLRADPNELDPFLVPLAQALPAHGATPEQFAEARRQRAAFLRHGETLFRILRPKHHATICDTSRIAPEVLASGEAHRQLERGVVATQQERSRHGAALQRAGARVGLQLDPARSRAPRADLDLAQATADLEERIRQREAAEAQSETFDP